MYRLIHWELASTLLDKLARRRTQHPHHWELASTLLDKLDEAEQWRERVLGISFYPS